VVVVVTRNIVFKTAVSCIFIGNAVAELLPGEWSSKFVLNLYNQSSDEGLQVYDGSGDQGVSVVEPMIFVSHQIDETTNISGHFVLDAWTAESDTRLDGNTGQSGAGIGNQSRTSANISYSKEVGKSTWTPRFGFSSEYDYKSFNGGLTWTGSFAEDNFTLGISGNIFLDKTNQFDYTNEVTGPEEDKKVYAFDITASQLITRSDIFLFGFSYIKQEGTLESIRNTLDDNGTRVPEELPDARDRKAFYAQWVHGFSDEIALSARYRFYTDDWDMDANSLETSLRMSVQEDEGFLEFNYRYHDQNEVKYFTKTANGQEFMTNDHDQDSFTSHRVGTHYSINLGEKDFGKLYGIPFSFESWEVSVGAYHYWRSNNLTYNTLQASLGVTF
jgi:hypothetical protein